MLTTWPPPRRPRFLLLKGEKNKCFCSTCFLLFRFDGEGAMLKTQLSICFKIYFPSDFKSLFLPFSISICLISLRLCSSSVSTCLVSSVYFYSFLFPLISLLHWPSYCINLTSSTFVCSNLCCNIIHRLLLHFCFCSTASRWARRVKTHLKKHDS